MPRAGFGQTSFKPFSLNFLPRPPKLVDTFYRCFQFKYPSYWFEGIILAQFTSISVSKGSIGFITLIFYADPGILNDIVNSTNLRCD